MNIRVVLRATGILAVWALTITLGVTVLVIAVRYMAQFGA